MTVIKPKEHKIKYLFLSDVEFHGRYFLMLADLIFDDANSAFSEFSLSELHRQMNVPDWFVTKAIDGLKEKKLIELNCQESNRVKGRKKLYVRLLKDDKWAYEDSCPALLFPHQLAMIKSLLPENGISPKNKRHPDLTFHDRAVLIAMVSLMSDTWLVTDWSHTGLGNLAGRTKEQIRNHVQKFIALGIVRKVINGFRHFGFKPIPTIYSFSPCSTLWQNVFEIKCAILVDGRYRKAAIDQAYFKSSADTCFLDNLRNRLTAWCRHYSSLDEIQIKEIFSSSVELKEYEIVQNLNKLFPDTDLTYKFQPSAMLPIAVFVVSRFSGTQAEDYIAATILDEITRYIKFPESRSLYDCLHSAISHLPISIAQITEHEPYKIPDAFHLLGDLKANVIDVLTGNQHSGSQDENMRRKDFFESLSNMTKKLLFFIYYSLCIERSSDAYEYLSDKLKNDNEFFLAPYISDEKPNIQNWLMVDFTIAVSDSYNPKPTFIERFLDWDIKGHVDLSNSMLGLEEVMEILMSEERKN